MKNLRRVGWILLICGLLWVTPLNSIAQNYCFETEDSARQAAFEIKICRESRAIWEMESQINKELREQLDIQKQITTEKDKQLKLTEEQVKQSERQTEIYKKALDQCEKTADKMETLSTWQKWLYGIGGTGFGIAVGILVGVLL